MIQDFQDGGFLSFQVSRMEWNDQEKRCFWEEVDGLWEEEEGGMVVVVEENGGC